VLPASLGALVGGARLWVASTRTIHVWAVPDYKESLEIIPRTSKRKRSLPAPCSPHITIQCIPTRQTVEEHRRAAAECLITVQVQVTQLDLLIGNARMLDVL
jgi:hypothetical protein